MRDRLVAVTGATGFVGSRLAPVLRRRGARVRLLVRRPEAVAPSWGDVVRCDLERGPGLRRALEGVETAYYLVHAMTGRSDFADAELRQARRFARAAAAARVRQVVYLGALGDAAEGLSQHLESRRRVAEELGGRVPTLTLRAGIIIGSGGASWQALRDVAARAPVLVGPRALATLSQPTSVADLIPALVAAADAQPGRSVDVAGPDVMTYADMIVEIAAQLGRGGLRVVLLPGPSWLYRSGMRGISGVDRHLLAALSESMAHPMVADGIDFYREIGRRPEHFRTAVRRAIAGDDRLTPPRAVPPGA